MAVYVGMIDHSAFAVTIMSDGPLYRTVPVCAPISLTSRSMSLDRVLRWSAPSATPSATVKDFLTVQNEDDQPDLDTEVAPSWKI